MQPHIRATAAILFLFAAAMQAADDESKSPSPSSTVAVSSLTEPEQKELQTVLDARLAREREYREAALAAQAAQARFEAANNAAEALFYKLCGRYKLDPEKYQISPDGKSLVPKSSPSTGKQP